MKIVAVKYIFKNVGDREKFLEEVKKRGIDKKSRAEAGCNAYDYYIPANVAGLDSKKDLFLYENWETEAAGLAHHESAHFKELGEVKKTFEMETIIERHTFDEK